MEGESHPFHGDTPLVDAARHADIAALTKLLADGAKINDPKGDFGINPMIIACGEGGRVRCPDRNDACV